MNAPTSPREIYLSLMAHIGQVIQGQEVALRKLLAALLTGGHVLLEDFPGTGKTTLAKALALSINTRFRRVQFTPDLLPSDILGVSMYNQRDQEFRFQEGPVFTNILLADEINRASPRTQSALLEAMGEGQVTVEGERRQLPQLFFVIATENPVEFRGTYPLPEAQMDRFMLKVVVGYPSESEERVILDRMSTTRPNFELNSVVTPEEILRMQELVNEVYVDDQIKNYVIKLVLSTRRGEKLLPELQRMVRCGASPRATINLTLAARAHALLQGHAFVTPDDVKAIAFDVLRHRILLSYEAEAEETTTDDVIDSLLEKVPVP